MRILKTKKQKEEESDILIRQEESSLAEFTKRPLPTDEQVEDFEERIGEEIRDDEVEESLNEIYHDDNGEAVDVQKIKVLKKRGFFYWLIYLILLIGFFGGIGYGFYYYIFKSIGSDATAINFSIEAETEVVAGEEFVYTIKYENDIKVGVKDLRVTVSYPDNFIISDIVPSPSEDKNSVWDFDYLGSGQSGEIKVKGRLIGEENKLGIISAYITYTPENFSSEFKREATLTTVVKDIGIDFDFDYASTALVGQEEEIILYFKSKENNFIKNFRITVEPQDNVEVTSEDRDEDNEKLANYTVIRPGVWQIDEVLSEERELPIKFKFLEKLEDKQKLVLRFEQVGAENEYYKFYEKEIDFDVMKSDLNINLIINGSRSDQGIDLGKTLNYSISYTNRGETEMKDVMIMAVLDGDYLDWNSLVDDNDGSRSRGTIVWTKNEIPELASLGRNDSGTIDFSINLLDPDKVGESDNYQIKSYAQFSVGKDDVDEIKDSGDNRSNEIINKINSDLSLTEAVRYFSVDNIPVGSGPNPPKVGEMTTYKVYWDVKNNIHELDDLAVRVKLPEYIYWNEKDQSSVGSVKYNSDTREVVWEIGRLPVSVHSANAEFSIGVVPSDEDKNKIMILLPGSSVTAIDKETGEQVTQKSKAQTTKLESDTIASGDGMVE